jgi:predicted ATPase
MELVERDGALAVLAQALEQAGEGTGRLVLVSGEAGVGKTALLRWFVDTRNDELLVLAGACDPIITPRPLGPLADIAASVGGDLPRKLQGGEGTAAVFDALLNVLAESRVAALLILEDLHWADEATLDLVAFLGRRVERTRVLVVVSFRDDEVPADHPLRVTLGNLPGAPSVRRLPLATLTQAGVAAVAAGRRPDPQPCCWSACIAR